MKTAKSDSIMTLLTNKSCTKTMHIQDWEIEPHEAIKQLK